MSPAARRIALIAAALALVPALATACTDGPNDSHVSGAVISHFRGVPSGVAVDVASVRTPEPVVSRGRAGTIDITTWSSGSCPRVPTSVLPYGSRVLLIKTVDHDFHAGDDACTGDLAPTTSVVRLPDQIDRHRTLLVYIDGNLERVPG